MKILCIEKSDESNKLKNVLNIVSLKENKVIVYSNFGKIKNKVKIVNKIKKILLKEKVDKIMPSIEIKEDKEFINLLHSNNIEITNEKWLFKMLVDKAINKIILQNKRCESEIWITVNDIDNLTQNIIYKFSKEFKRVNIITNHIRKFKKIEERLYEEDGIMITVTNNRRKSLSKANLVLNIDFPKELINQFTIFDNATIINLEGGIFIKKKRFCGKVINDIEIKSFEDQDIEEFIEVNKLDLYDIKDICDVLSCIPNKLEFDFL